MARISLASSGRESTIISTGFSALETAGGRHELVQYFDRMPISERRSHFPFWVLFRATPRPQQPLEEGSSYCNCMGSYSQ